MLNIILVTIGAFTLCISALICQKMDINEEFRGIKNLFSSLFYLIITFIFAYSLFLIKLFTNSDLKEVHILTISFIFFGGSMFVLLSLITTDKLIKIIRAKSEHLGKINESLQKSNNELNKINEKLMISEKKYVDRAKELEDKLDDFYTMQTKTKNDYDIKS